VLCWQTKIRTRQLFFGAEIVNVGYMSTSSKLKNQFARPVVVGIVSAVGAMAVGLNYNVTVPIVGSISKPVFFGALGVASSLATETVHQWVLPYLPQSEFAVKAENALIAPAIHAALNVGALQLAYPNILKVFGMMEPALIGAGAEIAGGYSFNAFVAPALM
jgi:hypothetical protein